MNLIGLDLGGTKLAGAIFETDGSIRTRRVKSLDGRTGKAVGALITGLLKELIEQDESVNAIGISVPGIYYARSGRVWAPNIPGWEDYPLLDELSSFIKNASIAVTVDSDRACYILGEAWRGAARGCSHAIYVAVGTGIGAGIMIDGKILRGSSDIAGATGWMALKTPFLPEYVACGCFEYHASGTGIAEVARKKLQEKTEYDGVLRQKDQFTLTAKDIFAAYDTGDIIAREVLEESIRLWGMATVNYVSLFNPEKIIFGGGVFGPAAQFIDRIRTEAQKWAQPISIGQVSIEITRLGGDAGLIGAGRLAQLALENYKQGV
ncbi:MAG: ROK family protein [Candidatus Marinimicrobia bacterium]|nr:ROK family protein [Candidatus Neomarinimicrobiota bacterium]